MVARAARRDRLPDAPPTEQPDPSPIRRRRQRQWGTERNVLHPPVLHAMPSRRALGSARFALAVTGVSWLLFCWDQVRRLLGGPITMRSIGETVAYVVLVSLLTASATAYLLARFGFLKQVRDHRRVPRAQLDAAFTEHRPTVTILVPSYREEASTIRQTLLSAVLQDYPDLRVVLLVDDPPDPTDPAHRALLDDALRMPEELRELLDAPRRRAQLALDAFESNVGPDEHARVEQLDDLAAEYDAAARWFRRLADRTPQRNHVDDAFVGEVLLRPAQEFESIAAALRQAAETSSPISVERARQLYRRLAWTFRVEVSTFERKRYASLSHEPNKAMNLNSYIGLMGGRYRIQSSPAGQVLLPVRSGRFDLEIPDPDYVLTLDADSVLLPEYCLRLVHVLEQPGNERLAIAQSPYSSFRNAPTRIERMAAATTDLQHIAHLGMSRFGAASWVGANAVIRKRALDDIAVEDVEAGFPVRRYIQDRTVIEDTESTLDLRLAGWQLHNVPERLAYSATPPDFGALCVQRKRWANGGLLCLGKLRRLMAIPDGRGRLRRGAEWLLRANYLASLGWATLGLSVLLAYPFDERRLSLFTLFTAVPYFVAQATDLRRCGYRRSDVLRLYGFNLLLLPVNAAGVITSLLQGVSGQKSSFARTPKISTRTVAPALLSVLPWLIVAWSLLTLANDIAERSWVHAAFAGSNALLTAYAAVAFHGVRNGIADTLLSARAWITKDPVRTETGRDREWVTVLYHGAAQPGESSKVDALAAALASADRQPGADLVRLPGSGPAARVIDLTDDVTTVQQKKEAN